MTGDLQKYLQSQASWETVNNLGHIVFYEGHLERVDELFLNLLPIVNMTYYKYLLNLDDRGYAKEDLLQDAMVEIYRDITLRWDKFIYVDDYFSYFRTLCKNVMLTLVHVHHNYYMTCEFDPDIRNQLTEELKYSDIEAELYRDYLQNSILELTKKLAKNRIGYSKVLEYLIDWKLVQKNTDINKLKSRVNISWWLKRSDINFLLDHVDYLHRFSYNYYLAKERGETKMIKRLDQIINRFEDTTYSILSKNYGESILPEIYAEFGPDLTKKFVKLFSGKQVTVPDYTEFCDDLVGESLLSLVSNKDDLYEISNNYNLNYSVLSRIFDRAESNRKNIRGK